jgi:hypothetical protein
MNQTPKPSDTTAFTARFSVNEGVTGAGITSVGGWDSVVVGVNPGSYELLETIRTYPPLAASHDEGGRIQSAHSKRERTMNELDLRNHSVAVYAPNCVSQGGIEAACLCCRQLGIPSLEVLIPAQELSDLHAMMDRLGFTVGGTETRDSKLYVKFRANIRGAGGINGDLSMPSLHDTRTLQPAIDGMNLNDRYSPEEVARRVREIEAEVERRRPPAIDAEYTQRLAAAALRTKHRRDSGK